MKFSQLTLRDCSLPGDFELREMGGLNGVRVAMFVGVVADDRERLMSNDVTMRAAKALLARDARGRRIAVPVGAVLWAEIAEATDDPGERS